MLSAALAIAGALLTSPTMAAPPPSPSAPPVSAGAGQTLAEIKAAKALKMRMTAAAEPEPKTAHDKAAARVKAYSEAHGGLGNLLYRGRRPVCHADAPDGDIPSGRVALAGINLHAETSQFTAAHLEAVIDALLDRKWATVARKYAHGFGYRATSDIVDLSTTAPKEIIAPLLQRFPGALQVTYAEEGGRESRDDDWPSPHHGGAHIVNQYGCTSGFTYKWNNENFVVTAGHCYPASVRVDTGV
jgi:hypothetical protein